MLRKRGVIFLGEAICFLLATQIGSAQPLVVPPLAEEEKDYEAWIEVEYEDSYLKIRAFCFNSTSEDGVLRYKLEARKSGKSGTAKSFQAGSVQIPSQEKKCLSQLSFSISAEGHYQIKLEVYKDGKRVAEDSLFYPRILKVHTLPGISSLFSLAKRRDAGAKTQGRCRNNPGEASRVYLPGGE